MEYSEWERREAIRGRRGRFTLTLGELDLIAEALSEAWEILMRSAPPPRVHTLDDKIERAIEKLEKAAALAEARPERSARTAGT